MSTDSDRRVPEPLRRHVEANNALSWAALVGYALNRGYAYWSSVYCGHVSSSTRI
jgi:hypothetical protein